MKNLNRAMEMIVALFVVNYPAFAELVFVIIQQNEAKNMRSSLALHPLKRFFVNAKHANKSICRVLCIYSTNLRDIIR